MKTKIFLGWNVFHPIASSQVIFSFTNFESVIHMYTYFLISRNSCNEMLPQPISMLRAP